MSRLILGLAGCAGVAAWGSQGCGVGQIHSFPRSRKQPLLPALQLWHPPCVWGWVPLAGGSWFLSSPLRWDVPVTLMAPGTRAESAPRHRQRWSLSLSTEELSTLQSCGPRAGLGAQRRRVGVGGLLILPGDRAHNRLGLSQSSCCTLDVPCPGGLGSLCPPEQPPGPYLLGQGGCNSLVPVSYKCGLLLGREENLYLNKGEKKAPIFSNLAIITTLWLLCCADAVLENGPVQLRDLHHEMHIFR